MTAVPRLSRVGPAVAFGGLLPRQSWRRALRVQFPAIPGWGLLLALVGLSVALVEGPVGASPRHSGLGPAAGSCQLGGPSPILAEGAVDGVPRLSWLGPTAASVGVVPCHSWLGHAAGFGFGGVGVPLPFLVEGPVAALPRGSWLVHTAGFGGWSLATAGRGACG